MNKDEKVNNDFENFWSSFSQQEVVARTNPIVITLIKECTRMGWQMGYLKAEVDNDID